MKHLIQSLPKFASNSSLISQILSTSISTFPAAVKRLPQPPFILQKLVVEKLLNKSMKEQIEMGDFNFLQNQCLCLKIKDMGLIFNISFDGNQLILLDKKHSADVHFIGNSKELFLLASRSEDPDTFFFQRKLVIEGNTELGLQIKNNIDAIDFDSWPNWLNNLLTNMAELINNVPQSKLATNN